MEIKQYKHLMLDIETMGNESYSSILSIAAVEFDIETGDKGNNFYMSIDLQSCLDSGLVINASTVMWWLKQNEEARFDLTERKSYSLEFVLKCFTNFLLGKDYEIWGNSARFDCGILQNAYNKLGIPIPWDFRKERCLRTLVSLNPSIKSSMVNNGVEHNPLSDCLYQIEYCCKTYNSLKK